jgi:hypothetical protein
MNSLRSLAFAVALTTGLSQAAEPDRDLDGATAVKLLNLQTRGRMPQTSIAMILEGSTKLAPFEARHVRKVIAVHPVPEDGKMVRRMQVYDFYWSSEHGWFLWETRQERGGDAVWIWSELGGETVVR